MNSDQNREAELFREAARRTPGAERQAFLDQACANDPALRQRLEALLQAHDQPVTALHSPTGEAPGVTIRETFANTEEGPGARIGRYKLLQEIGEGGMGVVYMAEQEEPVRRRVAFKMIIFCRVSPTRPNMVKRRPASI